MTGVTADRGLQILSNTTQQQQATGAVSSMASTSSSTSSSSSSSNDDITSSDFLTLLVSELQNQDPTQPTDPTTYVQQLVGVNSLEQLISINQDLGGSSSGSSSSSSGQSSTGSTTATTGI